MVERRYDPVGDYPPGTGGLPLGAYLKSEDATARKAGLAELWPRTQRVRGSDRGTLCALPEQWAAGVDAHADWIEYVPAPELPPTALPCGIDSLPDGEWCENGWHDVLCTRDVSGVPGGACVPKPRPSLTW